MKFSLNSLSPIAKFLIGMALVLVGVFLEVSSESKYPFFQGAFIGCGIAMQLIAVIAFFKKRKLEKQTNI
ncbi:MAG: hypothetical protein ACEQR6_07350 [Burkholderiaceae bacterium]